MHVDAIFKIITTSSLKWKYNCRGDLDFSWGGKEEPKEYIIWNKNKFIHFRRLMFRNLDSKENMKIEKNDDKM